jgi:hypothetical protein
MNKQTAVEWLVNQLNQNIDFIPINKWDMIRDMVQQAKAMEKNQIINAAMWMPKPFDNIEFIPELAKQYYNETYGKE